MRFGILLLLLFLSGAALAAPTALEIMQAVDDRDDGKTMASEQMLILANARGQKLTREVRTFAKRNGQDRKSIVFMLAPADLRNIGFLSYDWRSIDKDEDSWLYLPSLDRVDRIPLSNRSDAFMGSDFSYSDMDRMRIKEWDFKLLSESEQVEGADCYLIEAVPKAGFAEKLLDETGYSRIELWVRKDMNLVVQSKMYFPNSTKMKWLTVGDIHRIDGIITAQRLMMRTFKGSRLEHASVLLVNNVKYNIPLDDDLFTPARLRRGIQ